MTLPPLGPDGLLPLTPTPRHPCTLEDIEDRFVSGAMYEQQRATLWQAFNVWRILARREFGPGETWLTGTFIADTPLDPDLRVVLFPDFPDRTSASIHRSDRGLGLITVEDLFYMAPGAGGSLALMRSVGGLVDASVGVMAQSDGWEAMWSILGHAPSGEVLSGGFVSLAVT